MTQTEKIEFEGANALWNCQVVSMEYHLSMAAKLLKENKPLNAKLNQLEQKYGLKRSPLKVEEKIESREIHKGDKVSVSVYDKASCEFPFKLMNSSLVWSQVKQSKNPDRYIISRLVRCKDLGTLINKKRYVSGDTQIKTLNEFNAEYI
jgi:hypothetical protein